MRPVLLALTAAAVWAAVPASSAGTGQSSVLHRACAQLSGLADPLAAAASLEGVPEPERRDRLIEILRAGAAAQAAPVLRSLREQGSGRLELIWSAGVVCGEAPASAWALIERLPQIDSVFDDASQPDAAIDDAGDAPNAAIPPESPLVSLRVPEVWGRGLTGKGVVVALLDTGVDFGHADLASSIWINADEIASNGLDDDGNGFIDDWRGWDFASNDNDPTDSAGHGTNVAGLIAGNGQSGKQTGVAPGVRLMVIRRGTTESSLWAGSQYAIVNGAQILNQSVSWKWSFTPRPDYSAWRRQAETELAAGLLHVNSGGNTGNQLATEPLPYNVAAPANCPPPWHHPSQSPQAGVSSVIAVGNVDARSLAISATSPWGPAEWTDIKAHRDPGYPWAMLSQHQDYPTWNGGNGLTKPDLVAPGDFSQTTKLGGGYVQFDGTSAAAPRVTGILALMKQAVPSATPADLTRALLTSTRDLGPVGRDNRFGAGLPDALAAVDALGPSVRVVAVQAVDPGAPRGDGDGGIDAGEIVTLNITLQNTSTSPLGRLDMVLSAESVAIVRDSFAQIGSLGGAASSSPSEPFLLELPAGTCNQTALLSLEIRDGSRTRIEPIRLAVGTETRTALLEDDFEIDRGFAVSGTATGGAWVRQVPVATIKDGAPANPGDDNTAGSGSIAWITGNGATDPDAADVDGGRTQLTSPTRNTTGYARVELSFARWFFGNDGAGEDHFTIEASNNGTAWTLLEDVTAIDNLWRARRLVLSDLFTPGSATRIRFSTEDAIADDTVESALDDVSLSGFSLTCTPFTIAPVSSGAVGATLRLSRVDGGHLRLAWDPPSAAGGIDPPKGYRVTRSPSASSGFAEMGRPVQTHFTSVNGYSGAPGSIAYYLVESLP